VGGKGFLRGLYYVGGVGGETLQRWADLFFGGQGSGIPFSVLGGGWWGTGDGSYVLSSFGGGLNKHFCGGGGGGGRGGGLTVRGATPGWGGGFTAS